jgi:hypothetical protein
MSTKIYNGFRLNSDTDVFSFRKNVVDLLKPIIIHDLNKEIVDDAIHLYDSLTFNNGLYSGMVKNRMVKINEKLRWQKDDDNFVFNDLYYAALEQHKDSSFKNDYNQYKTEIVLSKNPATGDILGIFYGGRKYFELVQEMPEYRGEYIYYDNSDRPDNVTKKEWKHRAEQWDVTFGDWEPVLVQGLAINILSDFNSIPRLDIVEKSSYEIIDKKTRLDYLISQDVAEQFKIINGEKWEMYEFMAFLHDNDNREAARAKIEPFLEELPQWDEFIKLSIPNKFL